MRHGNILARNSGSFVSSATIIINSFISIFVFSGWDLVSVLSSFFKQNISDFASLIWIS